MTGRSAASPRFFATPADFRAWLEKNHATAVELWVGFHKRHTARASIDWPQSVDCALCFGWIDGLRKSLGAEAYVIRFTPRKSASHWSAINIARVPELTKLGLMLPAGLAAFARRDPKRSRLASYENRTQFDAATLREFRAHRKAWAFFEAQPAGYRRVFTHWVMTAKKEETRKRRLARLVAECTRGRRIDPFSGKTAP